MSSAVIDVGSNSVRMLFRGEKQIENTQLAEGLMTSGKLKDEAMARTADAVRAFAVQAKEDGAESVYAFATEAVRSAENGGDFIKILKDCGVAAEVIPSETEGIIGFDGAYTDGKPCVVDIGGASTEVTVGDGVKIYYSHSMPLGSVRLKDYSADADKQLAYARERVKEYGAVPKFDRLVSIGGSVSVLCAVMQSLEPYDPNKIHGFTMTYGEIKTVVENILRVPAEERKKNPRTAAEKKFSSRRPADSSRLR
jgi:exopolyphosphatase/guanosine-5'-triphosphate,3'-diphosphate pyrophosphatase